MRPLSSWTRAQRRGLLIVFGLSFLGHVAVYNFVKNPSPKHPLTPLPEAVLAQRDSLLVLQPPKDTLYPFNPNYMSAYHAYRLGLPKWMSDSIKNRIARREYFKTTDEVRRFLALNDTTWLNVFPYIKLPEYVLKKRKKAPLKNKLQLNTATLEQLQKVHGIGPVLATRILDMRNALGGFMSPNQLEDIWGLNKEVIDRVWHLFSLDSFPVVTPLNINTATIDELASNYYINYGLASRIVAYRSRHGEIDDLNQMAQKLEIDSVRIARIALYLNTKKLLE
jgi:DNA uptake protein ComE-like DNA-binding protein